MTTELLSLASVATIDQGRINAAFEHELQRCLADCRDRPGLDKPRAVTLTLVLTPPKSGDGDSHEQLEMCYADFDVKSKLPPKTSRSYAMLNTASGLVFNELSPDDARQTTLDMAPAPKALPATKGVANAR